MYYFHPMGENRSILGFFETDLNSPAAKIRTSIGLWPIYCAILAQNITDSRPLGEFYRDQRSRNLISNGQRPFSWPFSKAKIVHSIALCANFFKNLRFLKLAYHISEFKNSDYLASRRDFAHYYIFLGI